LSDSPTIGSALAQLNVPKEACHLVLLNGHFVSPSQRTTCAVDDGDTIAVWPPVAGG
jgi:sulfur carrier protein ThiS